MMKQKQLMITKEELKLYIDLLNDLYGEDFCSNFIELSELLFIEFELQLSPESIGIILSMEESNYLTYKNCGISYQSL
mgnify:CR=1 FL=1